MSKHSPVGQRKRRIVLLILSGILLVSGTIGGYFLLSQQDEAKIKKHLDEFALNISKSEQENPARTLLKLKSAADALDYPASVNIEGMDLNFDSPETFTSTLGRYRAMCKFLQLDFTDTNVTLDKSGRAVAEIQAHCTAEPKSYGGRISEAYDISATLVKNNNKWKIKTVKAVKALNRGK